MDFIQALVLGIVQGATEFVPISSSGHLVLVPWLLGWETPGLLFDTMAHWGTLLAVTVYFRRDLLDIAGTVLRDLARRKPLGSPESRLGWLLVLGTVPAVIAGLFLEDLFERLIHSPGWVAGFLLLTGFILWVSDTLGRRNRDLDSLRWQDALIIGLAQALAIIPGISRSGSTIGAGLLLGLDRPAAARFSFLLMVPVVFGAGLLQVADVLGGTPAEVPPAILLAGLVSAAVTGYAAIALLLDYLARHSVRLFAVYCWVFGAISLLVYFTR